MQNQVMTGVLPFASKDRDAAITLAISQKRPPADLSLRSLNISDYVRSILFSCWQHEQEKRPSIDWCRQALVTRSALLFDDIYSTPQDAVVNTLQLPRDTVRSLNCLLMPQPNEEYFRLRCLPCWTLCVSPNIASSPPLTMRRTRVRLAQYGAPTYIPEASATFLKSSSR